MAARDHAVLVRQATAVVAAADPALARVIERAGPCTLSPRRGGRTHFEALARSIVYQQLAGRAARAIWDRVRATVEGPFTSEAVLAVPDSTLRGAGLSRAKTESIVDLAARVSGGALPLARIGARPDAEVVAELCTVRGIGPWTAEMFLMFQLGRLDVWPVGDLGVRVGWARAHGLPEPLSPAVLAERGDAYRPWRSVAAWYCWRATEPGASP